MSFCSRPNFRAARTRKALRTGTFEKKSLVQPIEHVDVNFCSRWTAGKHKTVNWEEFAYYWKAQYKGSLYPDFAEYFVSGYGWAEDKEHCEEYGRMLQADPDKVSPRAKKRGLPQVIKRTSFREYILRLMDFIYICYIICLSANYQPRFYM